MGNNIMTILFMRSFLWVSIGVGEFLSSLSFIVPSCVGLVSKKGMLLRNTWQEIIRMLIVIYHKNQQSIYLKYDVLGRLLSIEPIRAARTRRDVTDPINLLLKSDGSIKNVRYAKTHTNHVGKKVVISWLVKLRFMCIVYMNQTYLPSIPVSTSILWI